MIAGLIWLHPSGPVSLARLTCSCRVDVEFITVSDTPQVVGLERPLLETMGKWVFSPGGTC